MITAVDTSVLLDVLTNDPSFCSGSLAAMKEARAQGALVVCPVVWAEVRTAFRDADTMQGFFSAAEIAFDPFDQACSDLAGELWLAYRQRGGKRVHLIPDFLVGSHAQLRAGRLLSRDRGFFRRYFEKINLLHPSPAR